MTERLRIQILAGAVGEFSSPELTFHTESYLVPIPPLRYLSGTEKTPIILPKVQVAGYT